jgi:outer membrane protein assembly factor BamB
MVYVTGGFRGSALFAIRFAGAQGDLSNSAAVVWKHDQDTPYVPSPLLYDGKLYFLKVNSGILSCFNAKTGEPHYSRQRLESIANIYASPVGAAGRVYLLSRDGVTMVIKNSESFEVLATNKLEDNTDASPALVDNEIYLRGSRFLYCIAEK